MICPTCANTGMLLSKQRNGRGPDICPECAARAEAEYQAALKKNENNKYKGFTPFN